MGQCSSADASAGATLASKAILSAGEKLPAIGEIAKLLLDVAKVYGKLADTQKEAGDVAAWATRVNDEYEVLRARPAGGDTQINRWLEVQLEQVERKINDLLTVARKITDESKAKQLLKAALFRSQFETAQKAVERVRGELDRTLGIDTNVTVHRIEEKQDTVSDKLDVILAKIDAKDVDANKKTKLRALVDMVRADSARNQAVLVDVAEKVVDGDGDGAAASLVAAPADVQESATALFAKAEALGEQGKWTEAIELYQKCVELDPENSRAWFALGMAYYEQNGRKNCEAEYEPYTRCIALDPKHVAAHVSLGNVLKIVRKDYDGAERHYWKAIELDPSCAGAHNSLGVLLKDVRKDYDGAEQHYRKAIELDPSYALAHNNLGLVLRTVRKDYDGAEKMYRKAIELDPSYALAHNSLGVLLNDARKDYDGAERHYRKAIELDPKHAIACWNLSNLLEDQKNDIPGAIKLVEECVRLGGVPGRNCEQRLAHLRAAATPAGKAYSEGLARKKEKKWTEAIELYQKCVELDPENSRAWFELGMAYYNQNGRKNCEAEIEPYTRCIALDPKHASAHGNLGNVLKNVREDYDGAERHYRKAIELDPSHAAAHNNLAIVLENVRKDYDGAEKMYRKAIELGPTALRYWNLSDLLEKKNDIPGAIEFTEKYIQAGNPDNDGEQRLAHLRAAATPAGKAYSEGLARKKEKKWTEAIELYQKCVELDPENSRAWFELGMAYYNQNGRKNCEAEIEPYTRCIALDPKHASAHGNLGNVLKNVRKDYDGAERHYRKAIELDPKYATAHSNLGNLLSDDVRKDYDGAERHYRKAIELDPKYASVRWNLSFILEEKNDIPGAIKLVEEYVRLGGTPGFDGEQRLKKLRAAAVAKSYSEGLARKNEKKWPEAIAAFQNCVALDANHSKAWYELGNAYYGQNGDWCEDMVEPWTRCIALDPKHAAAHNNLGQLLLTVRKDYDGAELHYRKAIELDPKNANVCWNLSLLLENQKKDILGAMALMAEYIRRGNPDNAGEQRLATLRAKLK